MGSILWLNMSTTLTTNIEVKPDLPVDEYKMNITELSAESKAVHCLVN